MPGSLMSSMKRAVPVSRARSSLRGTDCPTSLPETPLVAGRAGAWVISSPSLPGEERDGGEEAATLDLVAADFDAARDGLDGGGRLVVVDPLHRLGQHDAQDARTLGEPDCDVLDDAGVDLDREVLLDVGHAHDQGPVTPLDDRRDGVLVGVPLLHVVLVQDVAEIARRDGVRTRNQVLAGRVLRWVGHSVLL